MVLWKTINNMFVCYWGKTPQWSIWWNILHPTNQPKMKNNFEIAKDIVDQYNTAYLQGDTMLHIQEWIAEQIKLKKKNQSLIIDEDGFVTDFEKWEEQYCECCGSQVWYTKIEFTWLYISILQKCLSHINSMRRAWNKTNSLHIKQIKLTNVEYANINRLCNFGLLYRETKDGLKMKKGWYWVPVKRIIDFFSGNWKVAKYYVVKKPTWNRALSKERVTVDQINNDTGFTDYKTKTLPNYVGYILHDNIQ